MKKLLTLILLGFVMCFSLTPAVFAEENPSGEKGYTYEHDPMDNPNAAKDIVRNPDAVYGFSPSPNSERLKEYADLIDWTDPAQVEEARQERIKYHESLKEIYTLIETLQKQGKTTEEIAREASALRNQIRLNAYKDDPDGLALVKKSNLETYGNENGPTPESLFEKYGSWQKVLEKSTSPNPGMDACLGLYDDMYDTYGIMKEAEDVKAPSVSTGVEPAPDVYVVDSGDSLWFLGLKFYDSGYKWKDIYESNLDVIENPSLIYPGTSLRMPK